METYKEKVKHIVPAFLFVVVATAVGMAFLRWILTIQFSVLDVKEEVWTIWIPLAFPWIPITIWLRPRFRVLTFKSAEENRRFLFQVHSWVVMFLVLLLSQAYLTTATGKLVHLNAVREIGETESARYYKIDNFTVDRSFAGSHADVRTSGKYNEHLNFDLFFVFPLLNDASEIKGVYSDWNVWYGVKYHKQISNRLDEREKQQQFRSFQIECIERNVRYDFYFLDHFERKPNSKDLDNFLAALAAAVGKQKPGDHVVLVPVAAHYEQRNGNKLGWTFGSLGIGFAALLLLLVWPGYSEGERKKFFSRWNPRDDEFIDMLKLLVPRGEHFVSAIIVNLNILVFVAMILSGVHALYPNAQEMLEWGGNRRSETTSGEWWRLVTSMFLHGGIMHLVLNIFGLALAAIFVEPVLKRKNYAILYLTSGICGSVASIWWHENTVSVGASGAIFGLYGAILGLLLTDAFPKDGKRGMFAMIGVYVGINLVAGLVGGIDNAAHIGGLLSGVVLGVVLYKLSSEKERSEKRL